MSDHSQTPPRPGADVARPDRAPATEEAAGHGEAPRRTPPHGNVSPDGSRIWPRPALGSRVIVWGGTAVIAAAATAGTVIALRHIADRIAGPQPSAAKARPPVGQAVHHSSAPAKPARGAQADPARGPMASKASHDGGGPQRPRRKPKPRRRPLVDEIEETGHRLTGSVDGVVASLGAAFTSFTKVASQARHIMRDFGDAADLIRAVVSSQTASKPASDAGQGKSAKPADKAGDRSGT